MHGLTAAEVARARQQYGPNELPREREAPAWRAFLRQLTSPLVALMIGATALSVAFGERLDAIAIAAIVVINAVLGFVQEHRAERAIQALRAVTSPRATVVRDDRRQVIDARDVVPGDLLVLEAGDVVAADSALVEASALTANEAALTGESVPVGKAVGGEGRDGSVFMGTAIATGTARARVSATGRDTELGHVAHLLTTAREPTTPLQNRLAALGRVLLWASGALVVVVGASELARGADVMTVVLSAVSLAVAAVPEGLPAIVSIALAVGVRRMARQHALIRRLPAIETLGCTTVICSDKTGTLTTGVMAVRELWGADRARLLDAAAACCDADLDSGLGDASELAILGEASRAGIHRAEIERTRPRVRVEPFDAATKRMAIARTDGVVYVKGAIEVIAGPDDAEARDSAARMAGHGLRVLAVACGPSDDALELVGLVGIADPPRPEVVDAIRIAHRAGIRTLMITGDHALTARAIASELGLARPCDRLDDVVHARTSPGGKLDIVHALVEAGEIVAMTGDGVNDAPALREAHVGIAMGKTGTEVAREVSHVVLADDNFATIVAAIREGRGIFDNIRKALVYLLSGNVAELAIMLIASLAALPLPFLPIQLLWINLVTDGLPALALVVDPTSDQIMSRPPRPPGEPILRAADWRLILLSGAIETAVTLTSYAWALRTGDVAHARTVAFCVLVASELFRTFAFRSRTRVLWAIGAFGNLALIGVIAASLLAQLALLYVPVLRSTFGCAPLTLSELAATCAAGLVSVTVLEVAKLVRHAACSRR